ncbi:MAG: secondary thiamine-phosphate synthase enzyme YjbQ [Pyrinomonadaceae bacterium]
MEILKVTSSSREEMIDITREVERRLPEGDGICVMFVQHTTCGLTVNENADPDVQSDMLGFLRRLIPQAPTTPSAEAAATPPQAGGEPFFKHAEGNSDAHIKSTLVGSSVTIPFEKGKLVLGTWQGIYLCEFDGPRERKVVMRTL